MAASRAVRAVSFGEAADSYARYRPAPPPESADWLLPTGARRVADVGAGTGGFSRVVADRVDKVVAVELDVRMAAALAARSPRVAVVNAKGEALPIRTGSLDAVLISSAWHWLDPDLAVPEIARVLRPAGVLGVVWSGPRRGIDWVNQLLGRDRPAPTEPIRPRLELNIAKGQPFSEPESCVFEWSLPRTPAELIGLAGTYSGVITLPAEERLAVARRAAAVIASHPQLGDATRIDLPMAARCWKAIRLGPAP